MAGTLHAAAESPDIISTHNIIFEGSFATLVCFLLRNDRNRSYGYFYRFSSERTVMRAPGPVLQQPAFDGEEPDGLCCLPPTPAATILKKFSAYLDKMAL